MLSYKKKLFFVLLVILVGFLTACDRTENTHAQQSGGSAVGGEPQQQGAIEVVSATMPVLPPGQSLGVVYLVLRNNTDNMVVMNNLYSDITDHIEVHRNYYENGMMKMREVHHLQLAPKSKILFEPGGYHLMLFDIATAPQLGDKFNLTLEFEGGRSVTTQVTVKER